ncbi:hypothetical protein [Tabrizicola oligotrophica]|uniref:Uncharacterized protein n=1 Tax=Tabrizicola oligotrophica TaxID=2710650 RepID=A0A6M0QTQ5_9RHOB|nr:hypothetical protein [Tabrizicola oligotrophica]NEY90777.1 hypothetical protein [Tabrizicola oligotrophica]
MFLLLPLLVAAVFLYLWLSRRNSTLTRVCRWRQERAAGQWRCAACGAVQTGDVAPRDCLRLRN